MEAKRGWPQRHTEETACEEGVFDCIDIMQIGLAEYILK